MATTQIEITGCDNELYILASQGSGSIELAHIKSGYGSPVSYTFAPQDILASGDYTLTMIGINWGGPSGFTITTTTDGETTTYPTTPVGENIGVTWTESVPMTV